MSKRRQHGPRKATGTVQSFDDHEGTGVINSDATEGGCWVHFSMIVGQPAGGGPRRLIAGQQVEFTFEELDYLQDGYPFRAVEVWIVG